MKHFPFHTRLFRITPATLIRMAADVAILQVALIAALGVRLFVLVVFQDISDNTIGAYSRDYFYRYCSVGTLLLSVISSIIFHGFGFYTYGRYYQGRYKALVVFQAVSLAYIVYGFLSSFLHSSIFYPRTALVIAWAFSAGLLIGARVWTQLWERFVRPEREARGRIPVFGERHVLVIGGGGYIGSALLPKLLERGYRVRVLDALIYGDGPIQPFIDHPGLEVLDGDFRHVENVVAAMRDVDSVVHLGAIVGDPACNLDENLTIDVNLSATRMIAELARAARVERLVFASTCSVYGACEEMLDEYSRVKPVSLYGVTKAASEKLLLDMSDTQFSSTILRFATIYGLSGRTRFDLVVNLLTAKAKIDGKITIHGGDQWRPFVHVDDAAESIVVTLEAPIDLVSSQIFNVGSNEQNYTISEIGERVQQQVIGATMDVSDTNPDHRNYRVDFRKIRDRLGFRPGWTVEQGIEQVLEAIINGEITDYRDVRYSNVEFLLREGTSNLDRHHWARELIRDLAENESDEIR
ncbi:MAG: NAD-dependent dehydratase [Planctomycetaceae bacterium]|nr:NAD-dependent dehydratase [Planctomycetaceae bacterium]